MTSSRWALPRLALFAGAAAVLAAGCSDRSASPVSANAAPAFSVAGSPKATLVSNATKYSDAGAKPATGRSGSAQLTTRALLGKDGSTTLDISTGALDGGAAPGRLVKVQVKGFAAVVDSQVATLNYNGLNAGGAASFAYQRYGRNDRIQVQANITGIDPKRTDVVTTTTPVKLRPDVAATALTAPANAPVNATVVITATLREINGDVGARANCVLYVDGTQADQAVGIWVDAGTAVDCSFAHTFASAGQKTLRVAAESIVPGDFDATNDSRSAVIEIVEPTVALHGSAQVDDREYTYDYAYSYQDWSYGNFSSTHHQKGREQSVYLHAWADEGTTSAPDHFRVSETTGGSTVDVISATVGGWDWSNGYESCVSAYSAGENAWVSFCSYPQYNSSWASYHRHASDVVYYGKYASSYYYDYGYGYSYSYSGHNLHGSLREPGPDLTISMSVGSSAKSFTASPTVALVTTPFAIQYSFCSSWWYSDYCSSYSYHGTATSGWTSF